MGVDRIVTAGLALALATALVGAGPVIASPVASAEGTAAQVRSTDDTTVNVDDTSVPAAPVSSFVGSITTPARGETTVYVNGDLVLTPASCPCSAINGWKPYRVFAGILPVGTTSPWTTEYSYFGNISTYPTNAFIDSHMQLTPGPDTGHYAGRMRPPRSRCSRSSTPSDAFQSASRSAALAKSESRRAPRCERPL